MSFREWPARRMIGFSAAWVVVALGLLAGWTFYEMSIQAQQGNGVGAVSIGIGEALIVVAGPPLLLALVWYWMRRPSAG